MLWAFHGLGNVGNDALTPAPNLIAKEAETTRTADAHGALGDDAALTILTPSRRLFDDVSALGNPHLQGRMKKIATLAVLMPRSKPLEDAPIQLHRVPAGAKREPVKLNRAGPLTAHEVSLGALAQS